MHNDIKGKKPTKQKTTTTTKPSRRKLFKYLKFESDRAANP